MARRRNHYRDSSFSRGSISSRNAAVWKALAEMGDNVTQAAKLALKHEAERIAADAKARCPVYEGTTRADGTKYMDKRVKPGALRDSIKAEAKRGGTSYQISANARSEDGFLYGQIVEFSPKVNKPFLYPAMDANRESFIANMENAIRQAIKATAKG